MLPNRNKQDIVLIILIIMVITAGGISFWKDNFPSKSIKIEQAEKEKKSIKEVQGKTNDFKPKVIFIHLGGAVVNPGVYKARAGDRLYKILKKAGGPTSEANLNAVNLADVLKDGQKVIIPVKNQPEDNSKGGVKKTGGSDLININTAGKEELKKLNGIGPALAGRIIEYRKQHPFKSKQELKQVSGIGSKTFAGIKSQITY